MKHYYYAKNDQQYGPFTFDELKTKRLEKSTLVWTEGMQNWTSAKDIEELKNILISEPPPLPLKKNIPTTVETIQIKPPATPLISAKFDLTYKKKTEATFYGILLLVVPIIIKLSGVLKFDTDEKYNLAIVILSIASPIVRIAVTLWVVNIASSQNRNSTGWGWLAFLLPSITLIIIGQLKKLRLKIELDGSLPPNQQVAFLLEKQTTYILTIEIKSVLKFSIRLLKLITKILSVLNCVDLQIITQRIIKKQKQILKYS